jgi:aspartyl protease family protein
VALADDGHYWVSGTVNGVEARFLIDSGASFTALSEDLAHKAGLAMDPMRMAILHTANGTVNAGRSSVAELAVGPLRTRDLPVVVSANFGDVNVLGMNFLSKLKSWKVAGGELVLEP